MDLAKVLPRRLEKLAKLHGRCDASRSRYAFYDYLAEVLDFYRQLRRQGIAKSGGEYIARLEGLDPPIGTHVIRTLIDATSTADIKTKSRWTLAVRYAWAERRRFSRGNFKAFLRDNGGIIGCAQAFSSEHPTYRQRYRRFADASGRVFLETPILSKAQEEQKSKDPGSFKFRPRVRPELARFLQRRDARENPGRRQARLPVDVIK